MKLASFRTNPSGPIRIGAGVELGGTTRLVAFDETYPATMIGFIEAGAAALDRARRTIEDINNTAADEDGVRRLLASDRLLDPDAVTFLPPVPRPGKFISVGANYQAHGDEIPPELRIEQLSKTPTPAAFSKLPSVLIGHRAPILYPPQTRFLDYEIELGFIIGRTCKNVAREHFADAIYGYTIFNDVTMRDIQFAEMPRGLLLLGKNADTSGPMGPWLVTRDEIPDPQALRLLLTVNGATRQDDTTAKMIFSVAEIVAYWSQITLEPGDAFSTGTPSGVALKDETLTLKPGDRIAASIEGLGTLENTVVAA